MKAQIIAVSFGLALLATIGYGAWLVLETTFAVFSSLDRELAKLTSIACIAVLVAAWVISRGLGVSTRRARAMAMREEKTATYQLFLDFWTNFLRRGRTQADQLPIDLAGKLQVLDRHLALYGGTSVVKAHTALRDLEREKGAQHPDLRVRLGDALVAIRRDLGTDTPLNTSYELERLLLPATQAANAAAPRDEKFRPVLVTN